MESEAEVVVEEETVGEKKTRRAEICLRNRTGSETTDKGGAAARMVMMAPPWRLSRFPVAWAIRW